MTWAAASDNSLVLTMSNGKTIQFDGFWERDECMSLLQACGRYLKHQITVLEEASAPAGAAAASSGPPAATAATSASVPLAPDQHGEQSISGVTDGVSAVQLS